MNWSTVASHIFVPSSALAEKLGFSTTKSYDSVVLLRCINIRPNDKPWVTHQIRNLMDKRDKAYRLATKTGKLSDHDIFSQLTHFFPKCPFLSIRFQRFISSKSIRKIFAKTYSTIFEVALSIYDGCKA